MIKDMMGMNRGFTDQKYKNYTRGRPRALGNKSDGNHGLVAPKMKGTNCVIMHEYANCMRLLSPLKVILLQIFRVMH